MEKTLPKGSVTDRCTELYESLDYYRWEEYQREFIRKLKNISFMHLGARDQDVALKLLEELRGSH